MDGNMGRAGRDTISRPTLQLLTDCILQKEISM
jgi:hypothetical protein